MKRWKPTKGTKYWVVRMSHGDLYSADVRWDDDLMDKRLYGSFNCFKTRDEAAVAVKAMKETLKDIAAGRRVAVKSADTECPAKKATKKQYSHKVASEVNIGANKLTSEIFNHPECPLWANFASVSSNGRVLFHSEHDSPGAERDIGVFDNTDWENSMIKKPTKAPCPFLVEHYRAKIGEEPKHYSWECEASCGNCPAKKAPKADVERLKSTIEKVKNELITQRNHAIQSINHNSGTGQMINQSLVLFCNNLIEMLNSDI